MRIVIRPMGEPHLEIDVTERVVAAVAEALWVARGGNDVVNWLEAERHVARLFTRGPQRGMGCVDGSSRRAEARGQTRASARFDRGRIPRYNLRGWVG